MYICFYLRSSTLYEIPEVSIIFSLPQFKTAYSIYMSPTDVQYRNKLNSTSLVTDAFSVSGIVSPLFTLECCLQASSLYTPGFCFSFFSFLHMVFVCRQIHI